MPNCISHTRSDILGHVPKSLVLAPLLQDGPRPRHLVPERAPPQLCRPREPPRPRRYDKARQARLRVRARAQRPRARERRGEDGGGQERARVVVQALVPEQVGRGAQERPQEVVVRLGARRRRGGGGGGEGGVGGGGRGNGGGRLGRAGRGGGGGRVGRRGGRRRWRRWRPKRGWWSSRCWWRGWRRACAWSGRRRRVRLGELRAGKVERLLLVHRRRVDGDRLHARAARTSISPSQQK